MKTKTRIADLTQLLDLRKAEAELTRATGALTGATIDHAQHLKCVRPRPEHLEKLQAKIEQRRAELAPVKAHHDATRARWMATPKARREAATATLERAEHRIRRALTYGGQYSGDTSRRIVWAPEGTPISARTDVSQGDQYSRSCTFKKTDATHTITVTPSAALTLADIPEDIARSSAADGLPLLSHNPTTMAATWLACKGKKISTETGWLATERVGATLLTYHHRGTAQQARKHIAGKAAAYREHLARRSATERQAARERRRARLLGCMARVKATLADAKRLGFCTPGIQSFQSRHGIGDEATLDQLIQTGDPSAVRLALHVAQSVRKGGLVAA